MKIGNLSYPSRRLSMKIKYIPNEKAKHVAGELFSFVGLLLMVLYLFKLMLEAI